MITRVLTALGLIACLLSAPTAADATPGVPPLPDSFLWGVASSGFQSEGAGPDSNWKRYAATKEPYRNGVDFRHRYPEDIALAAGMGLKVFRFGIEWARVQPSPGSWDETELAYYDDVVRRIRAAGMRPMITLDHWVYPGWIADRGGWSGAGVVNDWLTYARHVVQRLHGQGAYWITFNEPTAYVQQEVTNGGVNPFLIPLMFDRLVAAHRSVYDVIHQLDPGAPVSTNVAFIPAGEALVDLTFWNRIADKLDYIGIDYYYGLSLDNWSVINAAKGEFWKVDPQPDGIYHALRFYHDRRPGLPLYIVENGMSTDNGAPRADGYTRSEHLRDHVYWLQRARADGMNVIGYNYWSITDNYEWGSYRPRFGLYTVNAATDPALTRTPTDAVATYRTMAASGGVPSSYIPVKRQSVCSLVTLLTSCLFPPRAP